MSWDRQPIKSIDERIQDSNDTQILPKEKLKARARQKAPLTTNGFTAYKKTTKKVNGKKTVSIRAVHPAGPIRGTFYVKQSFLGEPQYDDEIIYNWIPQLSLSVYDDNLGRALSAAEIQSNMSNNQKYIPNYFVNPMQDLDYLTIEALARFTIMGSILDVLTKFIVGRNFRPSLIPINPSRDPDKDKKIIEENQDVIDTLVQIDNNLTIDSDDFKDTSFIEKVSALISVCNIFNRSALIFGYDNPVTISGKTYKQIPSSLKFAHARDLGIIDVEPGTWRLRSVQWRNAYYMVPARDMIYLWNPLLSSKTRASWLYGDSMMMPMVDASRVVRKTIGVNFPAMAEATWSGMFVLAVKPQSQEANEKITEYQNIVNNMVRGGPNVLLEDPANISFHNVDFNPKINEFINMVETLIKYGVATTGLPHAMFYDEAAANRATMIGKIELAKSTVIDPMRAWIGRQISDQWYQRWYRLIYKESRPDLYKNYKIQMGFSDLNISEWFDKVLAVNALDGRKLLTDQAYGDLVGVENYGGKVDPSAVATPGGTKQGTFTIQRTENNL